MIPVIALVGRPNVGKSTLFNALTGRRDALVADHEGLTRDRRYGKARHEGRTFLMVDTGGLATDADGIQALTAQQARAAIDESDLLVFLVDARAGLTPEDHAIAEELRTLGKPVVVAANKTDGLDERTALTEFYGLGFPDTIPMAAAHKRGVGQLFEVIESALPRPEDGSSEDSGDTQEIDSNATRVAVVGRPNVGKSTLINRLLGEERVVAFDQPGTTRDTVHIGWNRDGRDYVLMDTAGVRRRSKVSEVVEKFSVIKAMQAIEDADVVVVMIDASEGVVDQDSTVLGYVLESGTALVIAVNKWDGLTADERDQVRAGLDRKLRFVTYAEKVFVSALHGSGLGELLQAIDLAQASAFQEISTSRLSEILERATMAHQPPLVQGRMAKLRYAHLGGHNPLRVVIHGNRGNTLPESYKRYLANTFRDALGLVGTPLQLDFRSGDNPFKDKKNVLSQRQIQKRRRLKKFVSRKKRR